jgi:subtilisin family serine protease
VSFSNINSLTAILAPGVNINSSVPNNAYGILSGTSMAAPMMTGAFALYFEKFPMASVDSALKALVDTGTLYFMLKYRKPSGHKLF